MTLARWAWPVALLTAAVVVDVTVGCGWIAHPSIDPSIHPRSPDRPRRRAALGRARRGRGALRSRTWCPATRGPAPRSCFRAPITELLDQVDTQVAELGRPYISINFQPLAAEATVALMDDLDERGVPLRARRPRRAAPGRHLPASGRHRDRHGRAARWRRGARRHARRLPDRRRGDAAVRADQAWYLAATRRARRSSRRVHRPARGATLRCATRVGPSEDARLDLEATGLGAGAVRRVPRAADRLGGPGAGGDRRRRPRAAVRARGPSSPTARSRSMSVRRPATLGLSRPGRAHAGLRPRRGSPRRPRRAPSSRPAPSAPGPRPAAGAARRSSGRW